MIRPLTLAATVFCGAAAVASGRSQTDVFPLAVGVHFDSTVSGGEYTIEQIAQIAERHRLDAAILADRDNAVVEFGLFPFRRFLRKRVEAGSISKIGAKNYFKQIRDAQQEHPKLILIPGAEALPFYYWKLRVRSRDLFPPRPRKWLCIYKLYEHLLVFGLKNPTDYENLPSLAKGYRRVFAPRALWNVVFLAMIVVGLRHVGKGAVRPIQMDGHTYYIRRRWGPLGGCLVGAGALLLIHGIIDWPREFDAYHGNPGIGPYQRLIDAVNARGGMVFWAHPEVAQDGPVGGVYAHTDAYYGDLLKAKDYAGFAIFWEGIKKIGCVGGVWDRVLSQYCSGRRSRPVWALGELDFEGTQGVDAIRETLTIVLSTQRTKDAVLDAIRKGRMYSTRCYSADTLRMDRFEVYSPTVRSKAIMGETLTTQSAPHLRIDLRVSTKRFKNVVAQLIRYGEPIETFPVDDGLHIDYVDKNWGKRRTYYRILVYGNGLPILATNPIFVQPDVTTRS